MDTLTVVDLHFELQSIAGIQMHLQGVTTTALAKPPIHNQQIKRLDDISCNCLF